MFRTFSTPNGDVLINVANILSMQAGPEPATTVVTLVGGLAFVSDVDFTFIRAEMDQYFVAMVQS